MKKFIIVGLLSSVFALSGWTHLDRGNSTTFSTNSYSVEYSSLTSYRGNSSSQRYIPPSQRYGRDCRGCNQQSNRIENKSFMRSSNGSWYHRDGRNTFGSDGTVYHENKGYTYGTDGNIYRQKGNTTFSSNGTIYQRKGDFIYGTDGTITYVEDY